LGVLVFINLHEDTMFSLNKELLSITSESQI